MNRMIRTIGLVLLTLGIVGIVCNAEEVTGQLVAALIGYGLYVGTTAKLLIKRVKIGQQLVMNWVPVDKQED